MQTGRVLLQNKTGMKSRLTPTRKREGRYRLYRCKCGRRKWIFESNVKSGASKSCGCLHKELIRRKQMIQMGGKTFGLLRVLKQFKTKKGNTYWLCKCKCGRRRWVHYGALVEGRSKSCGCCALRLKPPKSSLKGKRIGKLQCTGQWRRCRKPQCIEWHCVCDCGKKNIWISTGRLKGQVKSCGCLAREQAAKTQHKRAKHRISLNIKERGRILKELQHLKKETRKYIINMILLFADRNNPTGSFDDVQISKKLKVSKSLVANIRYRVVNPLYQKLLNKRRRQRWKKEPLFKLQNVVHHQIKEGLKRYLRRKKDIVKTKYNKYLGCTISELKMFLESKFSEGMNWKNHTNSDGIKGWHIHHIRPRASFDLSEEDQLKQCFHFTNLEPKWGIENIKESSYWNGKYWRNGRPFKAKRTAITIAQKNLETAVKFKSV